MSMLLQVALRNIIEESIYSFRGCSSPRMLKNATEEWKQQLRSVIRRVTGRVGAHSHRKLLSDFDFLSCKEFGGSLIVTTSTILNFFESFLTFIGLLC